MRIRPSVSSVFSSEVINGAPVQFLRRRDLVAQAVRVNDGDTLVIGGLIDSSDTTVENKIPILGDLPILGALARATSRDKDKSELIILLTPHIINQTELTPVNRVITSARGELVGYGQ